MMRLIAFIWKTLAGIALCLTPVTAVLVVGWLTRAMQRSAFKLWFHENGTKLGTGSFREFALSNDRTADLAHWPNWILGSPVDGDSRLSGMAARLFGSLWANLKLGLQMLLNTWILTLPASVIWVMSWWGGWENSFNKGYEQAAVAPLTALAGVLLFLVAMLFVPLAQARQAATGSWRAFYDFRLVRRLIRHARWRVIWLAISFAIAGLVMAGLHAGPLAVGNLLDGAPGTTALKFEQIAAAYNVGAGAVIFIMVVALRTAAARVYARALSRGVRSGDIAPEHLADNERAFFARLGLLDVAVRPQAGVLSRTAMKTGSGVIGVVTLIILLAIWFVFVAQLFVAQFLNHSWIGWLNLPLVQIPWFYGP